MAAKIILQRRNEFFNKVRGVKVFIDGAEFAQVKTGGSEEYVVEPGEHTIQCKVSRFTSREMNLELKEGETKFLKVRMAMKYFGVAYSVLLLAIVSDIGFRLAGYPKPAGWEWIKMGIIVPVALYFIYYMTFGRKQYLLLEEDKNNLFS